MPIQLKKTRVFDSMVLTPFIDIMMFLLLALIMSAELQMSPEVELPIKLPSVQGAVPMISEPDRIHVGIYADGTYVIDQIELPPSSVETIINQSAIDNPTNQQVIIHADRDVKYKFVATLIDICNRSKVSSYRVLVADTPPQS